MPGFLGGGLADPSESVFYVPIPKNASSAHRLMFGEAGWHKFYWSVDATLAEAYAPIRHPFDRWFSGVDQFVRSRKPGYTYEEALEQVLAGRHPVFDENTQRQTDFLLSTMANVTTVKVGNAGRYVKERWGYDLPRLNENPLWVAVGDLVPLLADFYSDDLDLYHSAI